MPSFCKIQLFIVVLVILSAINCHAGGDPVHERLHSIIIQVASSSDVKKLRQTGVEIIRVRPAVEATGLTTPQIVEAVATTGMINKLKALGYEISKKDGT